MPVLVGYAKIKKPFVIMYHKIRIRKDFLSIYHASYWAVKRLGISEYEMKFLMIIGGKRSWD